MWNVTVVYKAFSEFLEVSAAGTLQARKENPYPEYVFFPVEYLFNP